MEAATLAETALRDHADPEPHRAARLANSPTIWEQASLYHRLQLLRRARHLLAARSQALADAISPALNRNPADTLVAEVLPLLAACKFLEQNAATILAPRRLGRKGLPFWLAGLSTTVERVPLGTILIIGPANYPLFLPGVQALQALAAGNTVVWKPGQGGRAVALLVRQALEEAGLPAGTLNVTGESIAAATSAIAAQPAKIIFTGSAPAGRAIQHLAAERSIPVVAELSGCDAVFVLPGANPDLVVDALSFGMHLNGSATCMAPRRLFLVGNQQHVLTALRERLAQAEPVTLTDPVRHQLQELLDDARAHGSEVVGETPGLAIQPLLVLYASPEMRLAQTDLFAPVLSVFDPTDDDEALAQNSVCPYALTASVFGEPSRAQAFAARLDVGTVTINDLIVPTADPRISFGGRRASGFGATRGREGLLEMTAVKTTAVRHSRSRRHLQATTRAHTPFFQGIIEMTHAGNWSQRIAGLRKLVAAAKQL